MSGIHVGSSAINKVYVGSTAAKAVYLGSTQVWASSVAYSAAGAGATSTTSSISWSHTLGASDTAIVVGVMVGAHGTPACTSKVGASTTITAVTSGSQNFYSSAGYKWTGFTFALINPPTGAQTISATATGGDQYWMNGCSVSYTNAGSIGTGVPASGSSTTAAVSASSAVGNMVFCAMGAGSRALSAFNGDSRYNSATNQSIQIGDAAGAATVSFSATVASSGQWCAIAVPIVKA